jgi:hypothetical protein
VASPFLPVIPTIQHTEPLTAVTNCSVNCELRNVARRAVQLAPFFRQIITTKPQSKTISDWYDICNLNSELSRECFFLAYLI